MFHMPKTNQARLIIEYDQRVEINLVKQFKSKMMKGKCMPLHDELVKFNSDLLNCLDMWCLLVN